MLFVTPRNSSWLEFPNLTQTIEIKFTQYTRYQKRESLSHKQSKLLKLPFFFNRPFRYDDFLKYSYNRQLESTTKFAMILKMKLEASLEYSQKDIDQNKVELEAKV